MPRGRPRKIKIHVDTPLAEDCTLNLRIGNEEQTVSAPTMAEALGKLKLTYPFYLKGMLTIRKGEKHCEKILIGRQLKQLATGKEIFRLLLAKRLSFFI